MQHRVVLPDCVELPVALAPAADNARNNPRRAGRFAALLFGSACALLTLAAGSHAETASGSTAASAATTSAVSGKLAKLGYMEGDTIDRIENYRVDGWNYLDDQHILIYAGPSQRFLVTTLNKCPDLSSAEHIGFTSTTHAITKFDRLIVRGAGGIVQYCPITELRKLRKTDAKP